ncbi:MAG: electron transfer flavoprotein subunit beta/FixA family protein [Deferribacterota bacterium]|nr:electron transfer flavoprotein subunit beta/FixA family protein [Deferribacterota bacterium]
MNILVCIKQVPDLESKFKINDNGDWVKETYVGFRMNEYDEYAIEEAVQLKEKLGASEVDITVLSIGPSRVEEAIKKALAMGCDRGVHIEDNEEYKKDPFRKASIIYEFAKDKNFDIVFLGMQSEDRGSAQVGAHLGELLKVNCVTTVIDFEYGDNLLKLKRELEGGIRALVECKLPAVLTCQLGLNIPRYPTLPNIMKAKRKELKSFSVNDFDKAENLYTIEKIAFPEKKGKARIIEGSTDELVGEVLKLFKEKLTL